MKHQYKIEFSRIHRETQETITETIYLNESNKVNALNELILNYNFGNWTIYHIAKFEQVY